MNTVGAYEAKTHLPKLLERVRNGETITITKHGVPVAVLSPPGKQQHIAPQEVVAEIKALRASHRLDGLSVREMIDEGRP